jgi:adenylate cyclase class 1
LWQQRLVLQTSHLLLPLQRFLQSMVMRRDAQLPWRACSKRRWRSPIASCCLQAGQGAQPGATPAPLDGRSQPFMRSRRLCRRAGGAVQVTLYCDQQEFSELEHGDQLYAVVARQILRQRQRRQLPLLSPTWTCPICSAMAGSTNLYLLQARAEQA